MLEAVLSLRMACRDDDLPNAIRYFVSQFNRLSDLPVELNIDQDVDSCSIDTEVQLHLLRIVQEALSNARKYAEASLIGVKLHISDGILHLVISDNGQGFDLGQSPEELQLHFGLSTMRERAEAIGGQFRCESQPGLGTDINVDVPLKGN
jgi:signal transduction histidine kinase